MTPYLVTPPASLPVTLAAMKAHLRVVHDEDDADIDAKQAEAVAVLDGWGGLLGRCIMPQAWAVDLRGPGPHLLPFPDPDADSIAALSDGSAVNASTAREGAGFYVSLPDAGRGQEVTISATYGLPMPRLSAAQSLIKMMVSREFDAASGPEYDAMTRSIQAVIGALRWPRL